MGHFGLVYRYPKLYGLAMRVLYRGDTSRHRLVINAVPPGRRAVDLCCGDCAVAEALLAKECTYVGLELNPAFVRAGRKRGLDVRPWDARGLKIPNADVILLQSSLYQFMDRDEAMLRAMIGAARERVVISEPIRNWSSSGSALLRAVSQRLTHVGDMSFNDRYTEAQLLELVGSLDPRASIVAEKTRRDLVIVLDVGGCDRHD